MKRISVSSLALGAALLCVAPASIAQGNVGFADDSPMSKFSEEDFAMMRANNHDALESGEVGKEKKWRNESTGASGSITLLEPAKYSGLQCWRAKFFTSAGDFTSKTVHRLCKTSDGAWKAAP